MENVLKFLLTVAPEATARYAYRVGLRSKIAELQGTDFDLPLLLQHMRYLGSNEPAEGTAEADLRTILTLVAQKYNLSWDLIKPAVGQIGMLGAMDFVA